MLLACTGIALVCACGVSDADAARDDAKNVIYKRTTVGGSDAITVSNEGRFFHREKCKIHTEITISSVLHNGHRRNNPDATFYPGDALDYEIRVRFEGCSAVKTCGSDVPPNPGTACARLESICVLGRHGCRHGGFTGFGGSGPGTESGTAVIPHGIYGPDESYSVTKRSYAMAAYHGQTPRGAFSGYSPITSVASFPVRVLDPGLSTVLSHVPLTDSDGYAAANLDGTYYVWDPVHIVHETDYRWKDERIGTISVRHAMTHGILDNVHRFDCDAESCTHTINDLPGYDPHTMQHGYGGGSRVYNSTCTQGRTNDDAGPTCTAYHGIHDIAYESTLYNIDGVHPILTGPERARSIHNTTSPLLVQYEPEFADPYPYISLKDDAGHNGNWSWSKRHVMAVQYMGSAGGGRDDPDFGPHKQRRALLNMADYEGAALFVGRQVPIDAALEWSQAAGVSGPDDERCTVHDASLLDGAVLFGRHSDSAMFVHAGYGRVYFAYDMTDFMLENNSQRAVLNNTLQTAGFAGQQLRDIISYNYTYPAARFGIPASLIMTDSDGLVADASVHVRISPVPPGPYSGGLTHLHDHVCQNVLQKTGDPEYPNLVVSDMYPRQMQARTDTGGRMDYVLNRTSAVFGDLYALAAESTAHLDINLIYEAPSAYDFVYGVDDSAASRTRTERSGVTFTSPLLEIANIDGDNPLDLSVSCADCPHTLLHVRPHAAFGKIEAVEHNGRPVEGACTVEDACTISAQRGAGNDVTLTNSWGGTAKTSITVPGTDATAGLDVDVYQIIAVVLIGIAALVVWRAFGAAIERLRAMIGAN